MINPINPAFGDGFFPFLNGCHCSRTRGSAVAARCTHQALAAMADLPKLQQNYNNIQQYPTISMVFSILNMS